MPRQHSKLFLHAALDRYRLAASDRLDLPFLVIKRVTVNLHTLGGTTERTSTSLSVLLSVDMGCV